MNLLKSVKFWVGFGIVSLAVTATVLGYVELPEKVEKIEAKVDANKEEAETKMEETEEGYDKLANTVEKYIAVQAQKEEGLDKRQKMLEQIVLNMQK